MGIALFAANKFQQSGDLFRLDPIGGIGVGHALPVQRGIDGAGRHDGGHHIFSFCRSIQQVRQFERACDLLRA